MKKATILSGIDRLQLADEQLRGRRVGLMTNPTGMNRELKSTIDIVNERYHLTAMYAVEHGIRGDVQAGGKVETCVDPETGVTVFTAFGETSHFTDEMLDAFDVLVFDIQDVGARFYTYLYSLGYAMEACNRAGKSMVVLDRLNPIGGVKTGGTILNPAFKSFVGDYELPTQYGLTIGEAARYIRDYQKLTLDLTVIPLEGWERGMYLDDTDLPWVAPSPNCATLNAALCYIGTCVFEGTNLSEGRGTTLPFEVIGAPFINGALLEETYLTKSPSANHDGSWLVGEGTVFVLGDNRSVSKDSTNPTVGCIPQERILGRVRTRLLPLNQFTVFSHWEY